MTKKTVAEMIAVMQAFEQGKTIQFYSKELGWVTPPAYSLLWDWARHDYRVKPEPREFWINHYTADYHDSVHTSKYLADLNSRERVSCIRVREVIEE